MAILVDKCYLDLPWMRTRAKASGADESNQFLQRLNAVERYGRDLGMALPTSPRPHDKLRQSSGEHLIYNFAGLLDTIYRFCQLDTDHEQGIDQLEDIATLTGSLKILFESSLRLPTSPKVIYVTPDPPRDITREIKAIEQPLVIQSAKNLHKGIAALEADINIHLNDPELGQQQFLHLGITALNLHPYGDDVDELIFWGRT